MPLPPTAITIRGIKAGIVVDAPFRFGIDRRGPSRTVTYQVAGEDAADFCDALMGIGAFASLPYGWPQPNRYYGNESLMCERVDGEPVGARQPDRQLMRGDLANIIADYALPEWDVYGDDPNSTLASTPVPWSSLQTRGGFQEYAIPNSSLVTVGGANPGSSLEDPFKVRVPAIEYVFRRMMLPSLVEFDDILATIVGKKNDAIFFGKAAGTLMLESWDQDPGSDPQGRRVQEFGMLIRWRPIDWNYVIDPGSANSWVDCQDSTGAKPVADVDYSPLITYGVV